jgi:hypothetical protein
VLTLADLGAPSGRDVVLGIRPQHVTRAAAGAQRRGEVRVRRPIELVQPTGSRTYVTVRLGGVPVMAETGPHEPSKPGEAIELSFATRHAIRAITHSFAPGARVRCHMEGDTFEMEDQRNWTDASYKTYVRPLALPWPYTLAAGTELEQAVSLSIEGKPPAGGAKASGISVTLGGETGTAPALGVGLAPEDAAGVMANIDVLRKIAPGHIICHHDPRQGHDRATLETAVAAARALGAVPWLEAVVASVEGWEEEVSALAVTVAALGAPFPVVMLSPAPDLKCVLPGTPWPPCPPAKELFRLARGSFPGARIGGGMFSYFTEVNRKRPPHELLDFVSFTTSALVHAGDDRSVTEGTEALPYIARSIRAFIGGKPYAVGPSAIGMRDNPYGAKTMDNPDDIRQAMNRNDPRQRGLLGAAWNLAYFARFAYGGAEAIALGGLTGPFGVLHTRAAWPQAWYDDAGGLYPVYHVLRGMALKGARLREVKIGAPRNVQAIAARNASGTDLWLANLTGGGQRLNLEGVGADPRIRLLEAASFVAAASDPDALVQPSPPMKGSSVELDAYAVARIRAA